MLMFYFIKAFDGVLTKDGGIDHVTIEALGVS